MMVQMNFSIVADKVLLGTAPMMVSCLEPSLNSITVGMLLMPYSSATPGLSSVLSLYCRCVARNNVKGLLELSCNVIARGPHTAMSKCPSRRAQADCALHQPLD